MFNGTNLALNSDLALVSIQVKTLLYIVWQKARHPTQVCPLVMEWAYTRALENQQDVSPTFTHRIIKCVCRSRGGGGDRGSGPPLENHKNIDFFSNAGPDPLKIVKLPSQFKFWAIIGTPGKRHLNGVSLVDRRWPANSGIWIIPPPIKLKKKVVKVGPPLTKLSGSAHVVVTDK